METWQSLIIGLCGIGFIGDIILHFVLPSRRRKDNAESELAEHDADKAEVDRLLSELDHQQQTVTNLLTLNANLTERVSELNATVDKHIDRNRELSDRLYTSETDKNRMNERIIALTEERDAAQREADHYRLWHCERTDCQDPRGGRPPRDKLAGLKYEEPKKAK